MVGLSFDVLRVGKRYRLINFGDYYDFIVEEIFSNGDMKVKDLYTLEVYHLFDTIKFGKGNDFSIEALVEEH